MFSVTKEEQVEKLHLAFRNLLPQLAEKYDDSTTMVMNETGCIVGDEFPDIRGLMHCKNDMEQKVFEKDRSNMLVALWSAKYNGLEEFLEYID